MSKTDSGERKHKYVAFHLDKWAGGTSKMTRIVQSVYFDVCFYNWDKVAPMTRGAQALALADLEGAGERIIDLLVNSEKLIRLEDGSVYSEVAMEEGQKASSLYNAKSSGGAKGRQAQLGDSPSTGGEGARENRIDKNPTDEEEVASQPLSSGDDESPAEPPLPIDPPEDPPAPPEKGPTKAECEEVVTHWNEMASQFGLAQCEVMSDKRTTGLKARIKELGVARLKLAIDRIPDRKYLRGHNDRGWKAHFNWFIQPDKAAGLLEGGDQWNGEGEGGNQSGWRDL